MFVHLESNIRSKKIKAATLTYLIVHLKGDVKLQDNEHELEPGAHFFIGQRDVDRKHNVVGLDFLGHSFIKCSDLVTLVGAPWHEPFGALVMLHCVHAFGGQVVDCCGGAGSW